MMRITREIKAQMLAVLAQRYHGASTALKYSTPFELMIAVILSAQCTDKRVNIITERLFPRYNTPEAILALRQEELEQEIRDCGLFRSKAKNILAACEILCSQYDGQVPATFEELVSLPGVGRKTANVLLSQLFGVPALAVDTHVFRVANRLKLAVGKTPEEVEEGLKRIVPRERWGEAHHWLIWHGRLVCKAQNPACADCPLAQLCPSAERD